jgi:hypothetical protein
MQGQTLHEIVLVATKQILEFRGAQRSANERSNVYSRLAVARIAQVFNRV